MSAIDGWLEGFMHGQAGIGVILLVSLLLGLRHASDPDHLAAVTTMIASEKERDQARKAGMMGFLWGLGHGTALVFLGLPLVLLNQYLPEAVGKIAEVAIGCIIVLLAVRLLIRWRRGLYHATPTPTKGARPTATSTPTPATRPTGTPTTSRSEPRSLLTVSAWFTASAGRAA